jgi:hypothetical protein
MLKCHGGGVLMMTVEEMHKQLTVEEMRDQLRHNNLAATYLAHSEKESSLFTILVECEEVRARCAREKAFLSRDSQEAHDLLLIAHKHVLRARMIRKWMAERTEL